MVSAMGFAVGATVHLTLQAMPSQLVFGYNAVLNIPHIANWQYIKDHKQNITQQNNECKNANHQECACKVNDLVLLKQEQKTKCGANQFYSPCPTASINDNGTLHVQEGSILADVHNPQQVAPHQQ